MKPATSSVSSIVEHPAHYNELGAVCRKCGHPIECIDVVEHMPFNLGNAVKYVWRAGKKGVASVDLKKAIFYLTRQLERVLKEEEKGK